MQIYQDTCGLGYCPRAVIVFRRHSQLDWRTAGQTLPAGSTVVVAATMAHGANRAVLLEPNAPDIAVAMRLARDALSSLS